MDNPSPESSLVTVCHNSLSLGMDSRNQATVNPNLAMANLNQGTDSRRSPGMASLHNSHSQDMVNLLSSLASSACLNSNHNNHIQDSSRPSNPIQASNLLSNQVTDSLSSHNSPTLDSSPSILPRAASPNE